MNEKLNRIKNHVKENRKTYLSLVAGMVLGAAAALYFKDTVRSSAIIIGKNNTLTQTTILIRRGHPGNVIRCDQTGEVFGSQNRAARSMGISPSILSQHLNGHNPHAGGYTFSNLGEAI